MLNFKLIIPLFIILFMVIPNTYTANNIGKVINTNNDNEVNQNYHNYYYSGETLRRALNIFAKNNGYDIQFAKSITAKLITTINGRFRVKNNNELLNTLARNFGFNWFIFSGVIYITDQQEVSKSIAASADSMAVIRNNLKSMGLLISKFSYSEFPNDNKVIIGGPEMYVDIVLDHIKELNIAPSNEQFAVFRLKYASAVDTNLKFNGQQVIIPGVASVLKAMMGGNQNANKGIKINNQAVELIKNKLPNINANNVNDGDNSAPSVNGSMSAPLITADTRLNTIVIRDKAPNLKIYKEIIELLDVPAPLIQVDVLMVHVDQSKLQAEGIDWWASSQGVGLGMGANRLSSAPSSLSVYYGNISPGQVIVNNLNNFILSLRFLENNNIAKATSHPSIATIDNLPAVVNVTENLYITTPQPVTPGNSNSDNSSNSSTNNFQQAQIVTSLEITPHVIVTKDKGTQIKLAINLQDGVINDTNIGIMPSTTQSTLTSQAIVSNGQSILLAGYTKNLDEVVNTQVPILGSIPLLGWFFRSTTTEHRKVLSLYLVTPKIVTENEIYTIPNASFNLNGINLPKVPESVSINTLIQSKE